MLVEGEKTGTVGSEYFLFKKKTCTCFYISFERAPEDWKLSREGGEHENSRTEGDCDV